MSYAVIRTGGKQYRVEVGATLRVETLEVEVGSDFDFTDILMTSVEGAIEIDASKLQGSKVTARVVRHGRGKKVHSLKYTRRKGYQKRIGHRQNFTEVVIRSIG